MIIRHTEPGTTGDAPGFLIRSLIRQGRIRLAGNRRLKIYGTLHCASGKKMLPRNRIFFSSEAIAIQAGYRPCGHCMNTAYRQWKIVQHDDLT